MSYLYRVAVFAFLALVWSVGFSLKADAAYRVRLGDTLDIQVWQDDKLSRQVTVAPDGRIAFPLAGHLQAQGRTLEAIEADLESRLAPQYAGEINITVGLFKQKDLPPPEPRAPPPPPLDPSVYVTGEVAKPGQYFFKTRTNVLQAIALAGGLGPFAAERRIKIRRKTNGHEQLYDFDYRAFTSGEDMSGNINLRAGDVVIVPEKGLFE